MVCTAGINHRLLIVTELAIVSRSLLIAMKEINLFYTFGIVPYCYDTEENTFLYDKRDRFYNFLFKIFLPSVALVALAVLWPEVLFLGNSIMAYVFAMQVILNLSTLYINILANYRNVRFYKRLQESCSISDADTEENSSYWTFIMRISVPVVFYAYYEACLVIYTKVYDIRPFKDLCFYLIYYYLELVLILNMYYVELIIKSLRQHLKQIYHMDQSIARTTRQYFSYIRRKSALCHVLRFRMLCSAGNTYLAASAMLYTMMRRMEMEETFSSWIGFNEMVFNLGSCGSQLIGLAGLCFEVRRCSSEVC